MGSWKRRILNSKPVTKARTSKLENYTGRESIRRLNVLEKQNENCKDIVCEVMAAVKMEGADKVEFHAVYRMYWKTKR